MFFWTSRDMTKKTVTTWHMNGRVHCDIDDWSCCSFMKSLLHQSLSHSASKTDSPCSSSQIETIPLLFPEIVIPLPAPELSNLVSPDFLVLSVSFCVFCTKKKKKNLHYCSFIISPRTRIRATILFGFDWLQHNISFLLFLTSFFQDQKTLLWAFFLDSTWFEPHKSHLWTRNNYIIDNDCSRNYIFILSFVEKNKF